MQLVLKETLSKRQNKLLLLSSEKGASIWLTTISSKNMDLVSNTMLNYRELEHGFRLNKQQFIDATAMRYDLRLKYVPKSFKHMEKITT